MTEQRLNALRLVRELAAGGSSMEMENGGYIPLTFLSGTEQDLMCEVADFIEEAMDHYAECGFQLHVVQSAALTPKQN